VFKDIALLSEKYEVLSITDEWNGDLSIFYSALKQLIFLLRYGRSASGIFVMFAGYWSFLPGLIGRIFKTPVYVILGGTDAVSFPFLDYGSLRKPLLSRFIKWSCQLATTLLPVHESLIEYTYTYHSGADYPRQGIKAFYPSITTPYQPIYNGFDPDFFAPKLNQKTPNTFVTVAIIDSLKRFKLKGIDLVFLIAEQLPSCQFTIIGISPKMQQSIKAPVNVRLYPFLDQTAFISTLSQSQFFIQPSISEGFPNSFCEAMLCNCIPIGSSVGAIPLIIGDTGIIFPTNSTIESLRQVRELLAYSPLKKQALARAARQRVIDNFHIDRRKEALFKIIENG
jgi:glycosyltransferase involved in cell wall biosynthesis